VDCLGFQALGFGEPFRGPSAKWLKIKNPAYTQSEDRQEMFELMAKTKAKYD
jgi:hypothetical protein